MTGVNPQLLADLARLASRYPPADWERLIECLDDERRRGQMTTLLSEMAATSRAQRKKPSRRPRKSGQPARRPARAPRIHEALARMRADDPQRAELLDDLWLKLREREVLPTMAKVRAFAEATGAKGLESAKRDQAVTELMERLVDMPRDALERMMRHATVEDRKLGEEYERWVRLILGQGTAGIDDVEARAQRDLGP